MVERLRQEQQAVVAKHGSRITGAILKEMTYADAVIRWAAKNVICYFFDVICYLLLVTLLLDQSTWQPHHRVHRQGVDLR